MFRNTPNVDLTAWLHENSRFVDNYKAREIAENAVKDKMKSLFSLPYDLPEKLFSGYEVKCETEADAIRICRQFFQKNELTRALLARWDVARHYARHIYEDPKTGQFTARSYHLSDAGLHYLFSYLTKPSKASWAESRTGTADGAFSTRTRVGNYEAKRFKNERLDLWASPDAMHELREMIKLGKRNLVHPVTGRTIYSF